MLIEEKYRNPAADVAKGMAIMVIVLAHSKLRNDIDPWVVIVGTVAIPLFFFLSGVFLNTHYSLGKFLLKKVDILLKPYFVTLFFYGLVMHTFYITKYPVSDVYGALYGTAQSNPWVWAPMWFLPITCLTLICVFILLKYSRFTNGPWYLKILLPLVSFIIGASYIDFFWGNNFTVAGEAYYIRGLPFSIDLLPLSFAFMLLGTLCKEKVKHFSPSLPLLLLAAIVFFSLIAFNDVKLDMNRRTFINPNIALFVILLGAYLFFNLAYLISLQPKISKILISIGRASLFILIFHFISYHLLSDMFKPIFSKNIGLFYFYLLLYPITIIIPLLLKQIAERISVLKYLYLPMIK